MMRPFRIGLCFLVLWGAASATRAEAENAKPERLLPEAFELASSLPDGKGYGNWSKTLAMLRIASTMRLAGMDQEAMAALEKCSAHNARLDVEAIEDEIGIELCHEFTLLGKPEKAIELAKELTFRNYATVALYVTARTAAEMNHPEEAEKIIRDLFLSERSARAQTNSGDDLWARAFVRLAVGMNKIEAAREIVDSLRHEPWRSAALADIAEARAQQGKIREAMEQAAEIPDAYMAVLAYARLGAAFSENNAAGPLAESLDLLKKSASKIDDDAARDFALRIAVEKLAAAGNAKEAWRIVEEIDSPCLRAIAGCAALAPDNLEAILRQLERCPADDRPLAAEALVVACGSKAMAAAALEVASQLPDGWPRVRALCESARRLAQVGLGPDAVKLLEAAAESAKQISEPGWKCCACERLALGYRLAAHDGGIDRSLAGAEEEFSRLKHPEVARSLLPRVVEAAIASGRCEFAKQLIRKAFEGKTDNILRNRLVPMLVAAGASDEALEESSRRPLSDGSARRLMVYRLALAGNVADAMKCAEKLGLGERAEAFSDIAWTQIRRPPPKPCSQGVVGVSLHGSWGSWFPRLERLGVAWELMPFSAPYEEGPEGLKAKYSMLAYPGTGGHMSHVSVAGAENLREYLHSGGGFFGICAGQFLATELDLVACDTVYMRGQGPHQVQMRKRHPVAVGLPGVIVIPRRNGGMLVPKPGCEVLGWYDTIERYAALAASGYGLGRVIAFSPHPEGSSEFIPRDRLCINATYWANGGSP